MKAAVRRMIKDHAGKILPFEKLPVEAQAAIAWYMSVDGEAWDIAPKLSGRYANTERKRKNLSRALLKEIGFYQKAYGKIPFGFVEVPAIELQKSIFTDEEVSRDWKSFEEYHEWYRQMPYGSANHGKSRWPVIFSSFKEETLQDGWHRVHFYFHAKDKTIPCVWYPTTAELKKS